MEASTSSSATIARQTWEIENNIVAMDSPAAASASAATTAASDSDAIFEYDADSQTSIQQQKPWTRDPQFFKNVRISALALLKVRSLRPNFLGSDVQLVAASYFS